MSTQSFFAALTMVAALSSPALAAPGGSGARNRAASQLSAMSVRPRSRLAFWRDQSMVTPALERDLRTVGTYLAQTSRTTGKKEMVSVGTELVVTAHGQVRQLWEGSPGRVLSKDVKNGFTVDGDNHLVANPPIRAAGPLDQSSLGQAHDRQPSRSHPQG